MFINDDTSLEICQKVSSKSHQSLIFSCFYAVFFGFHAIKSDLMRYKSISVSFLNPHNNGQERFIENSLRT